MKIKEHIKALIIDDSTHIHSLLTTLLKREGIINISHSFNGDEGMKKIFDLTPDIIFLDNIMPKTCGMDVLKAIRDAHLECKVIMISSISSTQVIEDSKTLGANYYLVKPFLPEKIRYVLDKFLNLNSFIPSTT